MKNLKTYIEQQNVWRGYANFPLFDIKNLSANDVTELASSLSSDLSPENLHCDGEITIAQARAKYSFYTKVAMELNKTGHNAVVHNL
jgi:hypothetical protein